MIRGAAPAIVNGTLLLAAPFCSTCTVPVCDPAAIVATICVSPQLVTTPDAVPNQTWPVPCAAPKLEPLIVTDVPAVPLPGVALEITGVRTVSGREFDFRSDRRTCTVPDDAPAAIRAVIAPSVQVSTIPTFVPSQRLDVPCVAPKFVPVTVTCVPANPVDGDTSLMMGSDRTVIVLLDAVVTVPNWSTALALNV